MRTRGLGITVVCFLSLCAGDCLAQHLGARLQWQPQTENDPRLQQPVEIEIAGRAAVTGLPYADMTVAQRQQVLDRALRLPLPASRERAMRASFRVVETVEERRGDRFAKTDLQLRLPGGTDGVPVLFRKLETLAGEPSAPRTQ